MNDKKKAEEFNKEVNEAVKAFMLKITVIAGKYHVDPFQLLRDVGTDVITHVSQIELNYEKFKEEFKKGDLDE